MLETSFVKFESVKGRECLATSEDLTLGNSPGASKALLYLSKNARGAISSSSSCHDARLSSKEGLKKANPQANTIGGFHLESAKKIYYNLAEGEDERVY